MQLHDLSFDPCDPYWTSPGHPGLEFGVQVFTLRNVYGIRADATKVKKTDEGVVVEANGLTWGAGAFDSPGAVRIDVREDGGALSFRIAASHPEPIKSIKLLTRGYAASALEAGWWHATSEASASRVAGHKTPVQHDYPDAGDWLTPWIAVGAGDDMATVAVRAGEVRATRFFAHTPPWAAGATIAEIICEQDARHFGGEFATPEIRIRPSATAAEVEADFSDHLSHLESTFGLVPWEERPDVPDWARKIRLVVNLHGQHWTGKVFNTFDDMIQVLRFVTREVAGEEVLAYLPGWEGRYYWQYPFFTPADVLGGAEGFERLAAEARALGVRLMPMFGAHGANAQIFPQWAEAAFLNTTARYPVLLNEPDWDGDRAGEDDQVFLNTGHPGFQDLLLDQVTAMVEQHGIDVAYFDTTGAWFNDPRYNLFDGYRRLKAELARRHPGLMIAGEAWTDALLSVFPINLSWMGSSTTFRFPELLARYGRAVQHLDNGAPGLGSTGVFEGGYTPADRSPVAVGHLPSVSFVDGSTTEDTDIMRLVIHQVLDQTSTTTPTHD